MAPYRSCGADSAGRIPLLSAAGAGFCRAQSPGFGERWRGMHISVKKARIGFPLRLSVDSLSMSTPGMEIAAARVRGDVAMLPLLRGSAEVKTLALAGAVVNLGTPDSALYMKSAIAVAALDNASVGLISKKKST